MVTHTTPSTESIVHDLAVKARAAALLLAVTKTEYKNKTLLKLAEALEAQKDVLLKENYKDIEAAKERSISRALYDRLRLTPERLQYMAAGVRKVATLPDPVGEEIEKLQPPNGLDIRKVRVPIGVVSIIYESRPNVTIDCAALCLKSGNAAILRGGSEAWHTNCALAALLSTVLNEMRLPIEAVQLIPTTDRSALHHLLKLDAFIDCIIPRGGENLIRFVAENATIPVIKHYKGVCNLYIDKDADPDLAENLTVDAKCQRPGVCNAIENLFIHQDVASQLLPRIAQALAIKGVELRVDADSQVLLESIPNLKLKRAVEHDYFEEYLDLILAVKIVDSLTTAISTINTYGSGHSDGIVTSNADTARRFMAGVDAATVYWNASTRFTDGFQFGLGAEIGISTDKLHARGPMGLRDLCTYKYLVYGKGQMRSKVS